MSRYIDTDKLVNAIESAQQIGFGVLETQLVKDLIREQPTADVRENIKGEWIAHQDGKYHCSRCDDVAPKGYRWNYCPNCGARMKEKE